MLETPTITITRYPSYDAVGPAEAAGLVDQLLAAVAGVSGQPPVPAGAVPPFALSNDPAEGYRVPPAVGEQLLAALPPAAVRVDDRRAPLAAVIDADRVARHAFKFQVAVRAVVGVPRGVLTCSLADDRAALAALIAKAFGLVGGVVLTKDGYQAEDVGQFMSAYGVPANVIRNPGVRADRLRPRLPGPSVLPPGGWVVVPAGHPAWAAGRIPDPPVVVAADAIAARRAKVLPRLFARPDALVFGLLRTDRPLAVDDRNRVAAAFGAVVHDLERG